MEFKSDSGPGLLNLDQTQSIWFVVVDSSPPIYRIQAKTVHGGVSSVGDYSTKADAVAVLDNLLLNGS